MRNAALTLFLVVALGNAARSQRFTLLPQVGFENSRTKVNYNDVGSFSPIGVKFSPQASLRLNYSSKQGHGFFVGAATSRSLVSLGFTDPENVASNFVATAGDMQVRLEGGYQFNTKPISIGHSKQSPASSSARSGCGHCCYRSCSRSPQKARQNSSAKNNQSWVRIQPSIGLAYIPVLKDDIISKTQAGQTVYQYNAGNWNTALIAGTGFEFGRGKTRQFTVSVNYFRGLTNLGTTTVTGVSSGKTVTANLSSASSGWNMKVGIPFTLKSNTKTDHKTTQQHRSGGCGQYRMYRCNRF